MWWGRGRSQSPLRRGAMLVAAMIGLLLATAISASLLRTATAQRNQVRQEQLRLQAEWLADSGLERAAARLRLDADWTGETWEIAEDELGGHHAAAVTIKVARNDEHPSQRTVTAVADYPAGIPQRARVTRSVPINISLTE